jgi:hypothetical protein
MAALEVCNFAVLDVAINFLKFSGDYDNLEKNGKALESNAVAS